jgi:hypothetical protein
VQPGSLTSHASSGQFLPVSRASAIMRLGRGSFLLIAAATGSIPALVRSGQRGARGNVRELSASYDGVCERLDARLDELYAEQRRLAADIAAIESDALRPVVGDADADVAGACWFCGSNRQINAAPCQLYFAHALSESKRGLLVGILGAYVFHRSNAECLEKLPACNLTSETALTIFCSCLTSFLMLGWKLGHAFKTHTKINELAKYRALYQGGARRCVLAHGLRPGALSCLRLPFAKARWRTGLAFAPSYG